MFVDWEEHVTALVLKVVVAKVYVAMLVLQQDVVTHTVMRTLLIFLPESQVVRREVTVCLPLVPAPMFPCKSVLSVFMAPE